MTSIYDVPDDYPTEIEYLKMHLWYVEHSGELDPDNARSNAAFAVIEEQSDTVDFEVVDHYAACLKRFQEAHYAWFAKRIDTDV